MNIKNTKSHFLMRNTHRSFSQLEEENSSSDVEVTPRTRRAQEAVEKAKRIVEKNNVMVDELKRKNNIVETENIASN